MVVPCLFCEFLKHDHVCLEVQISAWISLFMNNVWESAWHNHLETNLCALGQLLRNSQ